MRADYAAAMGKLCQRQLLITVEYDQTLKNGSPFSVPTQEVRDLYGETYDIKLLQRYSIAHFPMFESRGIEEAYKNIFLLEIKQ